MFYILSLMKMKTLEMTRKKTDVITTSWDVVMQIADFLDKAIQEQAFMWLWFYENNELVWQIYTECTDSLDTWYNDLYYEWNNEYYTMYDFLDQFPEYEDKRYEQLVAWLNYLADKDLIPNVI